MKAARGEPRDKRLASELRARIYSGELAVGSQLPSRYTLAGRIGDISPTMVERAYNILAREGLLRSAQGGGTFVCERHRWRVTVSCVMPMGQRRPSERTREAAVRDEPAVSDLSVSVAGEKWSWAMTVEAAHVEAATSIAVAIARRTGAGSVGWAMEVAVSPADDAG